MLRQLYDDASDSVLTENNGVTQNGLQDSISFKENSIISITVEMLLH